MTEVIEHQWPKSLESGHRFKIIFADPPYNQKIKYANDWTGDNLSNSNYQALCSGTLYELNKLLEPGGTIWWLCPPKHYWIRIEAETFKLIHRYTIIKEESFTEYNHNDLTLDYRLLYCFQKRTADSKIPDSCLLNPDLIRIPSVRQEMGDSRADPRGKIPGQIWKFRRLQGTSLDHVDWHPAQLPPELLQRIVLGWSNPGDFVLDAFAGSGNMGLIGAARNYVLVDQSIYYVDKIKERLKL